MRKVKLLIGFLALVVGLMIQTAMVQAKTSYLSVAKRDYLQTQQKLTVTNSTYKNIKITIPKGTVVQVAGASKSKQTKHPFITIDMDTMSYKLRKPFYKSKSKPNMTAGIWATTRNFKKIDYPSYLRYYFVTKPDARSAGDYIADGNLWQGVKWPVKEVGTKGSGLKITVDGVLESYSKVPVFQAYAPKPVSYAKVRKTVSNGKTTDFYTKYKVKNLPMTRVAKKGNNQYRLSITRTGEHAVTAIPESSKFPYVDSVEVSERYLINNENYYMHTEVMF